MPNPLPIRPVDLPADHAEWLRLRLLLWPECSAEQHVEEMKRAVGVGQAVFVAVRSTGGLLGFLEASLRTHAEDCETQPVAYIEGWFVDADMRRRGIGRGLMATAEAWGTNMGCQELASDLVVGNDVSLAAHRASGFEETSRLVHLRKRLAGTPAQPRVPGPLELILLPDTLAIARLPSDSALPNWAVASPFFSITRTPEELSIVVPQHAVPGDVPCERDWRCLRVAGTLPFAAVGILAGLTAPLAAAGISVFALSTYDTDYLLIRSPDLDAALKALRRHGHIVR